MKKILNIRIDDDKYNIRYKDEIGNLNFIDINVSDLTSDEINSWDSNIFNVRLASLPIVPKPVSLVLLLNGVFSIYGAGSEPKLIDVTSLSDTKLVTGTNLSQKAVSDQVFGFVQNAFGTPLVSIKAVFGSDSVIINGNVLNYDTANASSNGILANAKQLMVDLFNS